jgi:probable HAF family extracellular repeat protein
MTFRTLTRLAAFTSLALTSGIQLAGQDSGKPSRYKLIDLGTLGGPNSTFQDGTRVINAQGIAIPDLDTTQPDLANPCFNPFASNTPDCFIRHATVSSRGQRTDLGTLSGGKFSQAIWIAGNGLIAGASDIGTPDPLTGALQIRAVLWTERSMIDLGTLGGAQSGAISVNSRGQVAGAALNTIPDDFSLGPVLGEFEAATQTRAFLWQQGMMRDLGTLGGPDSFATNINESGQVAGLSYVNSKPDPNTGLPPIHPFLWERGRMIDLGSLGGAFSSTNWLNSRGQVVGISDLAGDQETHPFFWDRGLLTDLGTFGGSTGEAVMISDSGWVIGKADFPGDLIHHAFVWKNGVRTDVGVVEGDLCTNGRAINSRGQAVGSSTNCAGVVQHLFLWENGTIYDLSALILPGSGINVIEAFDMNDRGEIAAIGRLANGNAHAVLLVPASPDDVAAANALDASTPPIAVPARAEATSIDLPFFGRGRMRHPLRGRTLAK